jgi:hypothetical protein
MPGVKTEEENITAVLHPTNVGHVLATPLFLVNARLVRSDANYRGWEKAIGGVNQ